MKILLVVNIVLPKVSHFVNAKSNVTGGWLSEIVEGISQETDVSLAVAAPYKGKALKHIVVDKVNYYFLPQKNLYDVNREDCKKIFNDFKPELLHIEGSEFKHANTFINSWEGNNVLSLQGVVNGIEPYITGGLSIISLFFSLKLPEFLCSISLLLKKSLFKSRLKWEKDTISKAQNILGRTNWDLAYARKYNSDANYFSVNRILREEFYLHNWDISKIEKHSIYVGNSYQPIKGFHFIVETVKELKSRYPNIKVYVAGTSPYDMNIKNNVLKNGYSYYIRKLIERYKLHDNFIFMGNINAEKVVDRLTKVNVYCLASVIENSPNSLGEAMLLGVPCVASFVGGVSDMATDNKDALLYRFDEKTVLINQISRIFDCDELAIKLSNSAKEKARINHSRTKNIELLLKCYKKILS